MVVSGSRPEIGILLSLMNKASPGLKQAENDVKALEKTIKERGQTIRNVGIGLTAMGAAGLVAANMLVQSAAKIETAFANVNTMLDAGQDAYSIYNDEINKLITTIPIAGGKVEALNGLYQVLSAGVESGAKATLVLSEAMKAAKAGLTETSIAVDAITTILNAYQIPAEEASSVSDILFQTVKMGKTTFEELASAIGPVTAIAAQVGVSFEEVASTMATLTKAGFKTKIAATDLRGIFTAFLKPSEEMKQAVLDNAQAFGVVTPGIKAAQAGLTTAKAAFEDASNSVSSLRARLEETAPVPAYLSDALVRASEGVELANAEYKAQETTLKSLQAEYNITAAAVKGLSDEMAGISVEEQKNRLEIMKIRQAADDQNRELTDAELKSIRDLEEANDRLAIKSQELSIQQAELNLEQSKRKDNIDGEKGKLDDLNTKISEQEGAASTAQTAIDEWTATYTKSLNSQLDLAEDLKSAAGESVGAWTTELGTAGESAITLMLETNGLAGSLQLLADSVDGDQAALAKLFPNVEGLAAVMPLVGKMAETAAEDLVTMSQASGAAEEAYGKQADTTTSKTDILNARLEIATETMADGATPAMLTMKEATVGIAEALADANSATGGMIGAIATYGSMILSVIGPTMAFVAQMMTMRAAKLAAAAATAAETSAESAGIGVKMAAMGATIRSTAATWASNAALMANPLVLVAVAVALLIVGLVLLAMHWDKVTEAVGKASKDLAWIGDIFTGLVGIIKDPIKVLELLSSTFTEAGDAVYKEANRIKDIVSDLIEDMFDWGIDMINSWVDGMNSVGDSVSDAVGDLGDQIQKGLGFSLPEEGPLREVPTWGKHLVQEYLKGIQSQMPEVRRTTDEVAGAIAETGTARPSVSTTNIEEDNRQTRLEVVQNFTNVDADTIAERVLELLAQKVGG